MICKKCGKETNDVMQYCEHCGQKLNEEKGSNDARTLGVLSIIFAESVFVGLILGIIGLVLGLKAKDKVAVVLNVIGIILCIIAGVFLVIFIKDVIAFFYGVLN